MKKVLFTLCFSILFLTLFINTYSQTFLAKDGYIIARDYARAPGHFYSDAKIYRINSAEAINPVNGHSASWNYFCYSSNTSYTYEVEVVKDYYGVIQVYNAYLVTGFSNEVRQELELTIINSDLSTQIAENNGGYQYRLANPSAKVWGAVRRVNDLPGVTQPYWYMYYSLTIGGTIGFWARIDAFTGSVLGTSGGGGGTMALQQTFETSTFPPTNWILSPASSNYWSRADVSGFGNGSGSAKFDYYSALANIHHYLYTETFTAVQSNYKLIFDHAYATYTTQIDSLIIWTSTNGGSNWNTLAILAGGTNVGTGMVTAPPINSPFVPSASQWATKQYNIPSGTNRIVFGAFSQHGNNLYLDNIKVTNQVGIIKISELVTDFKLYQNYPNPFNPSTNIQYTLPKNSFVKLVVYDVLGREIETLVNEKQTAGTFKVEWNASQYPGGVYFYRLTSKGFSETKKMILLK